MFLIKSFHAPANGAAPRLHFWQTPWAIPTTSGHREVGGWVTWSGSATKYDTAEDASAVNAIRALGGEAVDADRYLQGDRK